MKKRIINLRLTPMLFAFLVAGILIAMLQNGWLQIVLALVALVMVLILALNKKHSLKPLVCIFALVFIVGMVSCNLKLAEAESVKINAENAVITCRVLEVNHKNGTAVVDKIKLSNKEVDGRAKLQFDNLISKNDNIKPGTKIVIKANIKTYKLLSAMYYKNLRSKNYYTITLLNLTGYSKTSIPANNQIRNSVLQYLTKNTSSTTTGFIYAMFFGDRGYMDDVTANEFKVTGLAHIFAVSGLHIGVLYGFLIFLFKKLKANKYVQFILISLILLAYSFICGFSPSVVRATVMVMLYMIAKIAGKNKDGISVVFMSALMYTIIQPFAILEASFLMSYGAILGIILFSKTIKGKCSKLPKWISGTIGLSLSVNIMLIPLMAYYFGYFSIVFLLPNLFLLPIFSFAYLVLFASTLIGLLFPFLGFITYIASLLIYVGVELNSLIAMLPLTQVKFFVDGLFLMLYFILMFCISRFFMVKKRTKIIISTTLITCLVLIVAISTVKNLGFVEPQTYKQAFIYLFH